MSNSLICALVWPTLLAATWIISPPVRSEEVQVKGTRIALEPPPGYEAARRYSGFMDAKTGGSILVSELPPQAFPEIAKQLGKLHVAKKRFGEQGLEIETRRLLKGDGLQGILFTGRQTLGDKVYDKWVA